jgi:hypothetical protein
VKCLYSSAQRKEEERFLSAQADAFAGANAEEKASACSVRNDGVGLAVEESRLAPFEMTGGWVVGRGRADLEIRNLKLENGKLKKKKRTRVHSF